MIDRPEDRSSGFSKKEGFAKREQVIRRLIDLAGPEITIDLSAREILLKTGEVALLFGASERSVRDWADAGKLPCIRTLGGHRLFPAQAVLDAIQRSRSGQAAPPEPGTPAEKAQR